MLSWFRKPTDVPVPSTDEGSSSAAAQSAAPPRRVSLFGRKSTDASAPEKPAKRRTSLSAYLLGSGKPPKVPPPRLGSIEVKLDDLSDAQKAQLEEARKIYLESGGELDEYEEPFLLRFLVWHKWDMKKATKMLVSTAKWRASVGANEFRKKWNRGELKYATLPFSAEMGRCVWVIPAHGRSYAGDVVSYLRVGTLEPSVWMSSMSDAEYFELNLAMVEYQTLLADKLSVKTRSLVRQATVYDMVGIGMKHCTHRLIRRVQPVLQLPDNYYPELVSVVVVTNAPSIFHLLWSMVKVFLSKDVIARVEIATKEATPKVLEGLAPAAEVPNAITGGTLRKMPQDVAEALGYTLVDPAVLATNYINTEADAKGGDWYRVALDAAPAPADATITPAAMETFEA